MLLLGRLAGITAGMTYVVASGRQLSTVWPLPGSVANASSSPSSPQPQRRCQASAPASAGSRGPSTH